MSQAEWLLKYLHIPGPVSLTEAEMAENLTVTFYPPHQKTERLHNFCISLRKAFEDLGVTVIPFSDALDPDQENRIKPGIVTIEQGEGDDDKLAIRRVSSLYHNPVVTVLEGPPPIPPNPTLQETLDSIVGVLAWNLTHVPVFVEDHQWTFCTMNGAVVECSYSDSGQLQKDVHRSLIPKLAAQVVPPSREEIVCKEHVFDPVKEGYEQHIRDFMDAAAIWKENGLMLAHTSIEDLAYRNRFYKRIVSAYLDHRTGMSYGFLVKQLPVKTKPATEITANTRADGTAMDGTFRNDGKAPVMVSFAGKMYLVTLPDIWLLSTRSGCNKTDLNTDRDLLKMGLNKGKITIETPYRLSAKECRPSYDTYAILAHAVGNVIVASILDTISPGSAFSKTLNETGLSVSHWHGYPEDGLLPDGYLKHGAMNPPVSCSTPQSAVYALRGKLAVLEQNRSLHPDKYRGDVHVEPHHGTNITGCMTLTETAKWVHTYCTEGEPESA